MKYLLGLLVAVIIYSCNHKVKQTTLRGAVFGTTYSIIYDSNINYETQLDSLFYVLNKSMSTYQVNSDISKLNRNVSHIVDHHFVNVYETSKVIYNTTKGAFDPTIGNIVNAWDFGSENVINAPDSLKIDSLMRYVGFNKTHRVDQTIQKENPNIYLEFNAIAKGYAVDVVSAFLENHQINNYLVEIGGEIRVKGLNTEKKTAWKVGVEAPNFEGEQAILKVISLANEAMATSGTYRKFKVDADGNRYAHIINTATGYPSKTNLLSVSVIAKDCITADAYATAFKAMGVEKVNSFLKKHSELKVFLIFENANKEFDTLALNGFPE